MKTTPTISDHPLVIGKMIERNRIRNARWIIAMHRREKLKAFWYCAGIIAGAICIYWLWQPLKVRTPDYDIPKVRIEPTESYLWHRPHPEPSIPNHKPSIEING